MQRKKIIYVAAASPGEASADLRRLGLLEFGDALRDSLRVVVPARHAAELESLALIPKHILLRYDAISAAWLWARLMIFLGLSGENEVIVFSPPGQSRWLKLLALALRGRVSFSAGEGNCVPFSLVGVLRAGWRQRFAAHGPICLIAAASTGSLQKILADVRRRYPEAPVHGVLPVSLAQSDFPLGSVIGSIKGLDSLDEVQRWRLQAYARIARRCFGRQRFRRIILPWTNEKASELRGMTWWFLPLWRVEIYNENLDAFGGRNPARLVRHGVWRIRRRWERRRLDREAFLRTLPVGVMGSASSFYIEKILRVLREKQPQAEIHGLLPESLVVPAAGLFDSTEVLRGGFFAQWLAAWRFLRRRREYQCWVIPCTNEPYSSMKLLGFLLPLSRRLIYNELADGFAARRVRTLYRHYVWRLRDHLSYQIVAAAAGSNRVARLGHLVLYSGRLLAGAGVLWQARLRSGRIARNANKSARRTAKTGPRVDLLLLGGPQDGRNLQDAAGTVPASLADGPVRVVRVSGNGLFRDLNEAIQASDAEFVCLLDPECRMAPQDWIERLLSSFDDRTAQVGPELASLDGETVVRGLLLESRGGLAWNFDNAVRWHRRPECLEVDALPWLCVVFRRRIFAETGYFSGDSGTMAGTMADTMEGWADAEFSKRLRALGWRSVCNRSVTAAHPAVRLGLPVASQEVTEEIRR